MIEAEQGGNQVAPPETRRAGGDRVQALHVFDQVLSWARTLLVERLAAPFEGW